METATDTQQAELAKEAALYGVPLDEYLQMTPTERKHYKIDKTKRLKSEAKRLKVNVERWLELSETERDVERKEARLSDIAKRHGAAPPPASPPEEATEEGPAEDVPPGERVYTADPEVPHRESDPYLRDGVTVGRITEVEPPPDILGTERERHPRTLMDLYSRWPVGDGEHYVRVERTQPKQWQQIPCAGYLGDLREPISEKKFQQCFGGREYELTLYGPDPKGRTDHTTGLTRIKALTNPIKLIVPLLPPNLAVLPAMLTNEEAKQESQMTQPWNPFAPAALPTAATPTTSADAQVHKSNVDLVTNVLKMTQEENRELRKARESDGNGSSKQLLDWQKEVLDGVRKDAEARERILREELAEARRAAEKKEEEIEKIRLQIQHATGRTDGTALELVKTLGTNGAEREAQRSEFYRQQLEQVRAAHQDLIRTMEERQKGEIQRYDQRLRDADDYYKKLLDEERRKGEEREKHLKGELERVRRDERDAAEARVRETKERFEERLRDQEKAFEREIRTIKENWDTKLTTTVSTKDFELAAVRERLEEAKEEAAEARARADESNDPIVVMEKAKKNAEALGYQKSEDAPKTPWERFAATAGAGLGTALQNIDQWLPQAAAALSGGRNAPQQGHMQGLAAAPSPPQLTAAAAAARAAQARRPRAVAWASAGQPPTPPTEGSPAQPMGFQSETEVQAAAPPQQAPAQPPPQQQQAVAPQPAAPQSPPGQVQVENKLGQVFGDEAVMTFLGQMEMAINMGMEPDDFARRFIAGYRDAAIRMIQLYKPADVTAFVKTLPGSDMSAILRRDGTKFIAGLWSAIEAQTKSTQAQSASPAQ